MKTNHARIILSLLGNYTVSELRTVNGGLEALAALQVEAAGPTGVVMYVPQTREGGLQKVNGIKTLRVLFNLGLKEAKDLFEEVYEVTATSEGLHQRIKVGPFSSHGIEADVLQSRLNQARSNNSGADILECEFV